MWFSAIRSALRRLGTGGAAPVFLAVLLASAPSLQAQRTLSDKDILQYLTRIVAWYRDVGAVAESPADSQQAMFGDGLRQSSTEAVRLAFQFARAQATIPAAPAAQEALPGATRSRNLTQSAALAAQRAEQAQTEIDQLNRRLQTASPASRTRLLAQRDELTSELNFVKARRDALRTLIGFLTGPEEGGLTVKIDDLERSVPEAVSPSQRTPASRTAASQDFHPESSGIIGLTTQIFSISQRMRRLDALMGETDALRRTGENLRAPLRTALREVIRRGDAVAQAPESSDLAALSAQRRDLDALLAQFKPLSASTAPLSELSTQIGASRGRMVEWRGALDESYRAVLHALLLRLGMLAVALLLIFGFSELWRRGTMRYVLDLRRRRQFLLLRRIVVGFAVALVVILSVVTEFGSLATFAGFFAAGIAVAMQSIILSVVAYFFLVGRWGVRVGDRVTVSGVTGEVVDISLFRLYLMELGGHGVALQPTGRVVVFPNAVFFQPGAVFKQLPGIDYLWRAITLRLPATTDYAQLERRLLAAVESIYTEYRDAVERQHGAINSTLNLQTATPRPESRVRFVDSGLEITIRYPVEIRRAAEIEDRVTRELIQQVESESANGALKIEATAG